MSRRGRAAVHPHHRPEVLLQGGLVEHHSARGTVRRFDFASLPVEVGPQRSLAAAFAKRCQPGPGVGLSCRCRHQLPRHSG